jgi:hypothetical protein
METNEGLVAHRACAACVKRGYECKYRAGLTKCAFCTLKIRPGCDAVRTAPSSQQPASDNNETQHNEPQDETSDGLLAEAPEDLPSTMTVSMDEFTADILDAVQESIQESSEAAITGRMADLKDEVIALKSEISEIKTLLGDVLKAQRESKDHNQDRLRDALLSNLEIRDTITVLLVDEMRADVVREATTQLTSKVMDEVKGEVTDYLKERLKTEMRELAQEQLAVAKAYRKSQCPDQGGA